MFEEKEEVSIFAKPNKYGYKININHPLIIPHYHRFKKLKKTTILSDAERFEFEAAIFKALEKGKK